MLPKKLFNWDVIFDGNGLRRACPELTLPTLERKTEDFRSGGMLGNIKQDFGYTDLMMDLTLAEKNQEVLKAWGVADASALNLRFLGAYQADDATDVEAGELSVRGRIIKIELGSVKAGDPTNTKIELSLTYLKWSVNGTALIEVDLIAGTETVGGVSRSDPWRRALGFSG